jgi:nitrogen regulatory protein PII
MVRLIAVVKPFRAHAVLQTLAELGIEDGTIREAKGYGRQKHKLHRYLGSEYDMAYLPKVELSLFLDESLVPAAIRAIVGHARTGRMGDGKILILPCAHEAICW